MTKTRRTADADELYEVHLLRMRMVAFIIGFAAATFLMVAVSRAGESMDPPLLKEEISVVGEVITLDDLFENAGAVGIQPVFRSPDLGQVGTISAERVKRAAERRGLDWPNPGGVETITIRRDSRAVSTKEQEEIVQKELLTRTGAPDATQLDIRYGEPLKTMHLDPTMRAPIILKSLQINSGSGAFKAVIGPEGSRGGGGDKILRGRAIRTVAVYVPRKKIQRGATVSEDDLKVIQIPAAKLQKKIADKLHQIVGKAVKRQLAADTPIPLSDLEEPKLVSNNSLVDISFDRNGLSLKAEGRALQDGSLGEAIKVVNTRSKKTIVATVVGPNRVSVTRPEVRRAPIQKNYSVSQATLPARNGWEAVYRVR